MKLVQSLQTSTEDSEDGENDEHAEPREDENSHDLSDAFERELCELWDMSMNADVAAFLEEMETTEVLLDAVLKSQNSRVTEICVGILANMACSHDVCVKMMRNKDLVDIVTVLLDEPDAPVLVEVTRLIHVCLSNDEVEPQWTMVLETESVFKNFIYILENSLNVDLLTNCSQVVDKVLDSSDEMLKTWADLPLVTAVCEAMKQMHMRSEQLHIVETLLHILQMVSTVEQGVRGLVNCVSVVPLLCHFIAECGHDEGGIIVGREVSLTESFSVMNVILVSDPVTVLTAMEKDPRIMKVLLGLLGYSCKIHRKRSKNSINRLSFTESDEHKFERSLSNEDTFTSLENDTDVGIKAVSSDAEPSTSTNCIQKEENAEPREELQKSIDQDKPADVAEANRRESIEAMACSSKDTVRDQHDGSCQVDSADIHHQYFTVATSFLKDIIAESAKKCVRKILHCPG